MHSNYPVAPMNLAIAKGISMLQMAFIGAVLAGESALRMVGINNNPEWFAAVQENKIGACMGAWFFGNSIVSSFHSTGAFEVYFDGKEVFSKLKTGGLNAQQLFGDLDAAIQSHYTTQGGDLAQKSSAL